VLLKNYISGFLALYFIALLCMPCSDNCHASVHITPDNFATAQEHHHQESDQCSPLCYCTCCATTVIITANTNLVFLVPSHKGIFSILKPVFYSAINDPIWQPPKLA